MTAEWHGYRLVPEDVLFFRDGSPASLGEDHYLRSIFPPYPATLYGMVRTQRLLDEGCDLANVSEAWWNTLPAKLRGEVGEWAQEGSLALRGPWLIRDRGHANGLEVLLPAPHDLQLVVERANGVCRVTNVLRLLPEPQRAGRGWSHSNAVMRSWVCSGDSWEAWKPSNVARKPEGVAGWFLTPEGIARWMDGVTPLPEDLVDSSSLWSVEMRTGVGLESGRRMSSRGMLYTFGFIRLTHNTSIGFEIAGGQLIGPGLVRLGGEGRLALLSDGPSLTSALVRQNSLTNPVVALLTPGIFDDGSCPDLPDGKISAAVVSGTVRIGGWNLAERAPKPLWRAAPSGSVYYIDGTSVNQLDSFSEMAIQGFGLMLCGSRPRR
jgi:CRISPR-associated protein Cmr3